MTSPALPARSHRPLWDARPAQARQRAREQPRTLAELAPALPAELAAVVDAAVHPDPVRRPATPAILARALRAAADVFGPGWRDRQPFPLVEVAPGPAASGDSVP